MNYGFKSNLFAVTTEDGRNFVLFNDADYVAKDGRLFRIPVGATSDGASTPQPIWNLIPPFGKYWKAAVLHDAAYRNILLVWDGSAWQTACLPFEASNELIYEAMQSLGVDQLEAVAIYEAVALAGRPAFDADRAAAQ